MSLFNDRRPKEPSKWKVKKDVWAGRTLENQDGHLITRVNAPGRRAGHVYAIQTPEVAKQWGPAMIASEVRRDQVHPTLARRVDAVRVEVAIITVCW